MTIETTTDLGLSVIECASCGMVYAAPKDWITHRRQDHKGFYCPNGHSQFFPQESDSERYKRRLEEEQSRHANTQLELMATRKQAERLEKRIKNGVCPCCHRQFVQLTRHMKSKHPGFVK
jgi:hypothetical protein